MLPQKPSFFLAAAAETVTTQTMTKPLQPACAATVSDAGTVEGLILAWMEVSANGSDGSAVKKPLQPSCASWS
jgi:hypothetical protein